MSNNQVVADRELIESVVNATPTTVFQTLTELILELQKKNGGPLSTEALLAIGQHVEFWPDQTVHYSGASLWEAHRAIGSTDPEIFEQLINERVGGAEPWVVHIRYAYSNSLKATYRMWAQFGQFRPSNTQLSYGAAMAEATAAAKEVAANVLAKLLNDGFGPSPYYHEIELELTVKTMVLDKHAKIAASGCKTATETISE